jgi:hypothetical protein
MIQLSGPYGNCTIINVYNDCITDDTTNSLNLYAEQNARTLFPNLQDHIIWLGDFNRHHPIWEDERNSHLLTTLYLTKAQSLITLITDNALFMPLPKNIPTLQALNTKNWTRVDNVFCSDHIAEYFIKCNTCPNKRGPSTDHVPILSIVELDTPEASTETIHNYRDVDWKKFNEHLKAKLPNIPMVPITTENSFQNAATSLMEAITKTAEACIPCSRPSPYSK